MQSAVGLHHRHDDTTTTTPPTEPAQSTLALCGFGCDGRTVYTNRGQTNKLVGVMHTECVCVSSAANGAVVVRIVVRVARERQGDAIVVMNDILYQKLHDFVIIASQVST